jgi:pimeloyl-ACP methyl ester carboxylesterase
MEKEELEGEKINLMITQVKPLKGNSIIISIGDNILEFISFGEGPPILLIGGFSCDYSIWQFLLPMLTIHRKVIVYYPPGYGKSTLPQSATSWIDIASLLSQGLKHLNISHPIPVLGYSTGGAIALELALNFPAQVKSLGLISTSPMPNPKNEVFQLAMKELESIEPLLKHGTDLMPFGGTEVAKYTGILMRNYDVTNQLSHILCPTVVICGAADEVISPEMSKILQNGIKNSKLFTIQNTGHYAIITHADEIFKNIGEII